MKKANPLLVIQSHQPQVPHWIRACTETVEDWCRQAGVDRYFLDDEFFDVVPEDIIEKTLGQPIVATDIARLIWIKRRLKSYATVVWLDADFLVFKPDEFRLPETDFAVGREVWIQKDKERLRNVTQVHNAFLMFRQGNAFLEFYLDTALRLVRRNTGSFVPQFAGPKLLTALHNVAQLPVMECAGMLSPLVAEDIVAGNGSALRIFLGKSNEVPTGLNLCSSLAASNEFMQRVVDLLLANGLENR
ncbi:MAG: hypothetical protein AAF438_01575 [Pseudomonadota bacterium]